VLCFDYRAAIIHTNSIYHLECSRFAKEHAWINKYACADEQSRVRINEAGGYHAHTELSSTYLDCVACIGANSAAGNNRGLVSKRDVRDDLAFSFVSKEAADDYGGPHAQHLKSIKGLYSRYRALNISDITGMLSTVLARNIKKHAFAPDFLALIRKCAAKH
jgi:hypothetical protein